ncbi:2-keto-4-pentenoate hydratase [Vibrio sp. T21]|uniref:fumarylacetoacetate hydrolase family protein n=1 Tax=Vibrio parahaemolyticus TaxID=670 RepID=UPI00084AD817|nr:fumarylacetoacetate hydrolase family protein [Vibrio parahaemolyticus]PWF71134.1 2-keto-4-pentenoate hydratase [Vibrio sp. T21]EHK9084524.1 fumarylacetoacetate hydrolase family protein [Vibrio parahaemolyticus]EKK9971649.1 fumarylacetoacetate hydrolase family protein [Vibrio parahaemolyticus]ODX53161.1 2-keto-4-pentenoate hydratase [Vibrio parahaemolyticus]ODY98795.1 2-keto-4-pentenoate hydratase [Vibrio parahaemolyticus]
MKLATKKNGTRDGLLMVVNKDLTRCVPATEVFHPRNLAATMQVALDNWEAVAPQLEEIYTALNNGTVTGFEEFEAHYCESPLPRAYQWADGSAYVNHVELVRKARGAEMPESFWTDPLMYQGGSDAFIGPCDNIEFASDEWGIDFEGEVAVVTGDVPMGASIAEAQESIRLIMLVNDVSLRGLIPAELAKGFGFFQSKPSSAFSPVAVTPDELGDAWYENKVHLPLVSTYNHKPFGRPNAGVDMTFDFADLIVHATKTRPLSAGAIIGSGTVSNKQGTDHGTSIEEGGVGYSCIAEVRMIETIRDGKPATNFMSFGDSIKLEMFDVEGNTIFGAIDQQVSQYLKH